MIFNFNPFSYALIFIAVILFILTVYTQKRKGKVSYWFSLMLISNFLWTIGYAFELSSTTFSQAYFFVCLKYIGLCTLCYSWIFFYRHYCNKTAYLANKKNYYYALIIPLITLIVVLTNPFFHLYYKEISLIKVNNLYLIEIKGNIFYYLFIGYFYIHLLLGISFFITKARQADTVIKKQVYIIILGVLIPWFTNTFYLFGYKLLGYVDITPFAFFLTVLIIFIAINKYRLFDIYPISREKILDLMDEGILILDHEFEIIDYNKSLFKFIPIKQKNKILGEKIQNVITNKNLILQIEIQKDITLEISSLINKKYLYYEADIKIIIEKKTKRKITIIKFNHLAKAQIDKATAIQQTKELEELNQLKNRIFSIIAHDLRGPLINISEVLRLLVNEEINEKEFTMLSPSLGKDINYTSNLLDNLLQWSRSQLKGMKLTFEFINLRNLILKEADYHQAIATQKEIKINYEIPQNLAVFVDEIMLKTIIRNILNNAIKFSNQNGLIQINARIEKKDWIILSIKDNGVGMSVKTIESLFTDENSSQRGTNNEKGTGLGMIIIKDFIKKLNGNITVESDEKKGSTFIIWLPCNDKIKT